MLCNLILLGVYMSDCISPALPSQYTLPVSLPIRFDLPGNEEYIDVRKQSIRNVTEVVSEETPLSVETPLRVIKIEKNGHGKNKKRKNRRRPPAEESEENDDYEYDHLLFNEGHYKRVSKWSTNGPMRRRNRFKNTGNYTSRRHPKKKKNWHNNRRINKYTNNRNGRKSNLPNRPNRPPGGNPAGGRYRSVDPRQKKVQRHILRFHNILRSHVDPPAADMLALGWYPTAAEQAQAWAEQCGTHTQADHPSVRWTSRYGACGQNVLVASRKRRWSYVLRRWWSSKNYFKFGEDTNNSSIVSAYTQMAWYNSHQVGCGFAECSTTTGSTFFRYVCNYCPAGNDPRRLSRPYTRGLTCRRCPHSCKSICSRGQCKLCTNACTYSDLWVNCATLNKRWHEWLCNTKTTQGVERFKNCRATCQCMKHIT